MRTRAGGSTRIGGGIGVVILAWLIIGAIAGGQRNYYHSPPTNCATTATIAETIAAGPLNYTGMNPKVNDCHVNVPQPSR
jgi:hypothetical protein